jgi:hypothetical protein
MTTFRQIEANRRNALRSTGPKTDEGKRRSRPNAVRHGLTAETVVPGIEDADDYKAFEATIIADYHAETAVARELVLRLASLLWRLRRATSMETDLFAMEADSLVERRVDLLPSTTEESDRFRLLPFSRGRPRSDVANQARPAHHPAGFDEAPRGAALRTRVLSNAFLRIAQLDSGVFERLNRYETALWRQALQITCLLHPLKQP